MDYWNIWSLQVQNILYISYMWDETRKIFDGELHGAFLYFDLIFMLFFALPVY